MEILPHSFDNHIETDQVARQVSVIAVQPQRSKTCLMRPRRSVSRISDHHRLAWPGRPLPRRAGHTVTAGLAVITGTEECQHVYVVLTCGTSTNLAHMFTRSPQACRPRPTRRLAPELARYDQISTERRALTFWQSHLPHWRGSGRTAGSGPRFSTSLMGYRVARVAGGFRLESGAVTTATATIAR